MTKHDLQTLLDNQSYILDRSFYPIIEVGGKEHREWIHRISSQASLGLNIGDVCTTAFLTGTAGVISYFQLLILTDKVWILAEPQSADKILKYLDFSHFGEDIYFKMVSVNSYFEVVGAAPSIDADFCISAEAWNPNGRIYINAKQKPDLPTLPLEIYQAYKRSLGWPIDQLDINEGQILLEATVLSQYASDTKGCYPGQEVIAKIITYKRVAKKYIALWSTAKPESNEIQFKDGKAGTIIHTHTLDDGYLILAYVLRVAFDQFVAGGALTCDQKILAAFSSQPS
jgi:folate-binding protein YgfZ